ncbi:hypothetical protein [Pantoea agglomerans]|uniref:hypothetical protein n=1 Tax=Enterobacter agglomerans TaxID=549 RepID=UPI0013B7D269|nr:hypothetical protein [Pantoea agglomerans]NEG59869.1 hypothetical protein [Pantoea agglomerans]NEG98838.1 hypothetical protein [Pantoea agglomerans]NEH05178.1 hypothetical protein [Pantoea agglomerans]NEH16167.1 hypothetical protein [Pantoea agglomerans]
MSNTISPNTVYQQQSNVNEPEINDDFTSVVYKYISENKPSTSLNELLEKMKNLMPDQTLTMQKLTNALIYSDTILRNTDEFKSYTNEVLDKYTCQLYGINMLMNNMVTDTLFAEPEDPSSE